MITPEVLARFIATELEAQAESKPYGDHYAEAENLANTTLDGHFDLMKLSTKIIGLGIWDAVADQFKDTDQ